MADAEKGCLRATVVILIVGIAGALFLAYLWSQWIGMS